MMYNVSKFKQNGIILFKTENYHSIYDYLNTDDWSSETSHWFAKKERGNFPCR